MPDAGIGLIETIAVRGGRAPLWPLHLERLRRSAAALGVALPDAIPRPTGGGDHLVRYLVSAGRLVVSGRPLDRPAPIRLRTAPVAHQGYPHKIDQREWLDRARAEAVAAGADDVLFLDRGGRVVEASIWAIGWWEGDGMHFPAAGLGGLRSVARRRLGELVPITDAREPVATLHARSVVACNAARGLVEVATLDGRPVARDPRTAELRERFWERADA